jgi:lysophospholipase L1-like esterase
MINKKIASEIAIGAIIVTAITMGGLILSNNSDAQKKVSSSPTCGEAQLNTSKGIVFLGDSITALNDWNDLFDVACVTNFGISGNTTDDVIERISAAVASRPRKLFLMIGINDLLRGKEVSYVAANYEVILNKIKMESPDTTVYMQSVLPINNDILKSETADQEEIPALNVELKKIAKKNKIFFIDLYLSFAGADNKMYKKYAGDGLHPSSVGYAVWKKMIAGYVE